MFVLLEKVLAATSTPEALSATSLKVGQAIIQAQRANAAKIEIGPSSTLASGKGYELVKPTTDAQLASITITPAQGSNCLDLKEFYLFGTKDDGVNIIYEEI
jgi:hypothetical protein